MVLFSIVAVTSMARHFCRLKEISYPEKWVAAELGPGSACQVEEEQLPFLGSGSALDLRRVFENHTIYFLTENGQKSIDSAGGDGWRSVEDLRNLYLSHILPLD
jgi:hypothetical protein